MKGLQWPIMWCISLALNAACRLNLPFSPDESNYYADLIAFYLTAVLEMENQGIEYLTLKWPYLLFINSSYANLVLYWYFILEIIICTKLKTRRLFFPIRQGGLLNSFLKAEGFFILDVSTVSSFNYMLQIEVRVGLGFDITDTHIKYTWVLIIKNAASSITCFTKISQKRGPTIEVCQLCICNTSGFFPALTK